MNCFTDEAGDRTHICNTQQHQSWGFNRVKLVTALVIVFTELCRGGGGRVGWGGGGVPLFQYSFLCMSVIATVPLRFVIAFFLITKTCLYNVDPLKPHFYIVKLGFTGVYIIFLISSKNINCGYSLEPPHRGSSNEYSQSMFWAEIKKISKFLSRKFSFFGGRIFNIFE